MPETTIEDRVIQILSEQLGLDLKDVKPESDIMGDLSADSLDAVEIVMSMEEEFGFEIPDGEAEKFVKVSDIIDYIRKQSET